MVWWLSAVLGDCFPSDNQIHPIHSFSCFNFYSISIKLHFLSSAIFLVSNSIVLPSVILPVPRTAASWQTAFSELLSHHFAACYLFLVGVVQVQEKTENQKCLHQNQKKYYINSKGSKEAIKSLPLGEQQKCMQNESSLKIPEVERKSFKGMDDLEALQVFGCPDQ